MYIEEVIIEGFKTYARRTEVRPFDPQFTAITGLNGSGKSNLLDSICFVLGINHLNQVRVQKLEELIHNKGGVTKASVTVVFNNEDKAQSPTGYSQYDQITVTRQIQQGKVGSKYLINGHAATPKKVTNLFLSVQLNVNNPHFLIMQGMITKVTKMRPTEVLHMLEEASGTSLYEKKKTEALKTLKNKESKEAEINRVLAEEINPTLEKRRAENQKYQRWVQTKGDVDRLNQFCIAHAYWQKSKVVATSDEQLDGLEQQMIDLQEATGSINEAKSRLKVEMMRVSKRRDEEEGGTLKTLEEEERELSKRVVAAESELKNAVSLLQEEESMHAQLSADLQSAQAKVVEKKAGVEESSKSFEELTEENKTLGEQLLVLQQQEEAAEAGVAIGGGGAGCSMTDQLMGAKQAASQAKTEIAQIKLKLKREDKELKEKRVQMEALGDALGDVKARSARIMQEKAALQKKLAAINYDSAAHKELHERRQQVESRVRELSKQLDQLAQRCRSADFHYSPPKGFDTAQVKGSVGRLIQPKDARYSTALEVAAGARLRNVVVANQKTAQMLLKTKLPQRTTFIPLDKIRAHVARDEENRAQTLAGPDNVHLALSVIDYEGASERAMQYVFGQTLIAEDQKIAQVVAFDRTIRKKTVTLDGDVYDPSGTITGGLSKRGFGQTLEALAELKKCEHLLHDQRVKLDEVTRELKAMSKLEQQYRLVHRQFSLKEHEWTLLQEEMKSSSTHQLVVRIEELEGNLKAGNARIKECIEEEASATQLQNDLETQIKEFSNNKESQIKKIKKEIQKTRKRLTTVKKQISKSRDTKDTLAAELIELKNDIDALEKDLDKCITRKEKMSLKRETCQGAVEEAQKLHQESSVRLEAALMAKKKSDKEVAKLYKQLEVHDATLAENEVKRAQLDRQIARFNQEVEAARRFLERMEKEHTWILDQRRYFGVPHTDYDFETKNPQQEEKKLAGLVKELRQLEGKINKKVASMISDAEQRYQELQEKKAIVEADRHKILDTIHDLDVKKIEALDKTYAKVCKDFGAIFTTLLPGAKAKLTKVDENDVTQGLEIRVAFGGSWKESLAELSGGQRSLLALSLILSLCKFRPAPIYILDEVDAALDPSHTQNVGQVIAREFPQSQFIIVSLKEGMFSNANTLVKTSLGSNGATNINVQSSHGKKRRAK